MLNIIILKIMLKTALVPFSYGKIVLMKAKKSFIFTGAALGLGLVATAALLADKIGQIRQDRMVKDIRAHFSQMGDIQVLYLTKEASPYDLTGGVVMTDGRVFEFTYDLGELIYQEVPA